MISSDDFERGCKAFAAAWAAGSGRPERWQWHQPPTVLHRVGQGPRFIGLGEMPVQLPSQPELPPAAADAAEYSSSGRPEHDSPLPNEDGDTALLPAASHAGAGVIHLCAAPRSSTVVLCDYHVVYHPSYRVPVLCLLPRHQDGRRLTWSEAVGCLAPDVLKDMHDGNRWDVITEQDHPVLNRPCYMLHPCQTAALLELLLPSLCDSAAVPEHAPPAADGYPACEANSAAPTVDGGAAGPEHDRPAAATADAAPWQLRYMLAWWSIIGPAIQLALPTNGYV